MYKELFTKIKESFLSILPVFLLVIVLHFTLAPLNNSMFSSFIVGTLLLVLGMSLFTLGADNAMMPIGNKMGSFLSKHKSLTLLVFTCFLLGTCITIAEPDLKVLAEQASYLPSTTLIITVAIGVGIFLALAALRIIFKLSLSKLLLISYGLLFILTIFIPSKFIPLSFDSGGVTTGPITVPFIMALGVGIASVNGGETSKDDSFGLIGLCSIGPIVAVLFLSLFFKKGNTDYVLDSSSLSIFEYLLKYGKEVLIALSPIVILFIVFQIFFLKISKKSLIKILISIVYTFIGLVLFLVGVNYGFSNVGNYLGKEIGSNHPNILIPLGMIMGLLTILAEPAVYVLNKQVEEISSGLITRKSLTISLALGVSLAVGLSMLRIAFDIPVMYILLPGYLIALVMTFFTPKLFTAIAFDSGGVASGPMAATFILPFAIGACLALNHSVVLDAFGLVAFIALTPLISIQVLGIVYNYKLKKQSKEEQTREFEEYIELEV